MNDYPVSTPDIAMYEADCRNMRLFTARQATAQARWTSAVAQVAARAARALPGSQARLQKALQILQTPGSLVAQAGHVTVQSQADPGTTYYTVCRGTCTCEDFQRHASPTRSTRYACKHLLAVWISIRAQQLLAGTHYLHQTPTGTVALGHQATAEAQRAADEAAGGLVARVCGYGF